MEKEEKKFISVGKSLKKARVYLKKKGYNKKERQTILNNIRHDIPNAKLCNSKFMLGLTRMYDEGELTSSETIMELNNSLKYVADETHNMEYDYNLNGLSSMTLNNRFKTIIEECLDKDKIESAKRTSSMKKNADYQIVPIDNYEEASKYSKYTSWCVTQGESAYNSYTFDGAGRFYFCLKKGFEKVKPSRSADAPLDEYGMSMIAVSVTMDGDCNTITCRYNHDCGGNDSIMSVEDIEKILGDSFYNLFPPYTEEELRKKGKYISSKIGKYYVDLKTDREGIIVAVDENENPTIIMSLDGQKVMNWHEAMEYNNSLKNGWHISTKDEFESIWFIKGWNNVITKKINNGINRYNELIYGKLSLSDDETIIEWHKDDGEVACYATSAEVII